MHRLEGKRPASLGVFSFGSAFLYLIPAFLQWFTPLCCHCLLSYEFQRVGRLSYKSMLNPSRWLQGFFVLQKSHLFICPKEGEGAAEDSINLRQLQELSECGPGSVRAPMSGDLLSDWLNVSRGFGVGARFKVRDSHLSLQDPDLFSPLFFAGVVPLAEDPEKKEMVVLVEMGR